MHLSSSNIPSAHHSNHCYQNQQANQLPSFPRKYQLPSFSCKNLRPYFQHHRNLRPCFQHHQSRFLHLLRRSRWHVLGPSRALRWAPLPAHRNDSSAPINKTFDCSVENIIRDFCTFSSEVLVILEGRNFFYNPVFLPFSFNRFIEIPSAPFWYTLKCSQYFCWFSGTCLFCRVDSITTPGFLTLVKLKCICNSESPHTNLSSCKTVICFHVFLHSLYAHVSRNCGSEQLTCLTIHRPEVLAILRCKKLETSVRLCVKEHDMQDHGASTRKYAWGKHKGFAQHGGLAHSSKAVCVALTIFARLTLCVLLRLWLLCL